MDAPLISSHYLPGGKFVVLLYESGSIELREIQISDAGGWNLVGTYTGTKQGQDRSGLRKWVENEMT